MVAPWLSNDAPMVFQWVSYVCSHGFPLRFLCVSRGCPMVFQWLFRLFFIYVVSYGFRMVFLGFLMVAPWFSNDLLCSSTDVPMVFYWVSYVCSHGFPLGFVCVSHGCRMVF